MSLAVSGLHRGWAFWLSAASRAGSMETVLLFVARVPADWPTREGGQRNRSVGAGVCPVGPLGKRAEGVSMT